MRKFFLLVALFSMHSIVIAATTETSAAQIEQFIVNENGEVDIVHPGFPNKGILENGNGCQVDSDHTVRIQKSKTSKARQLASAAMMAFSTGLEVKLRYTTSKVVKAGKNAAKNKCHITAITIMKR